MATVSVSENTVLVTVVKDGSAAVTIEVDVDNGAVIQYAIQDSGGDGNVGKDLVPLGEGLVEGKDAGRFLIPPSNELEEQIGALNIHGEITNLVDDEHSILGQYPELVQQAVLKMGLFELLNELVASSSICRLSMGGKKEKSKSSRVFLTGKPDIWICFS